MQNTLNTNSEVGIIAYWKKDKHGSFHCYHYFYVPKPCKRLLRYSMRKLVNQESSTACLYQVLYTTCDDELFMFYQDNAQIHLAILNLEVTRFGQLESIENRHCNKRGNLDHQWKLEADIPKKAIQKFMSGKTKSKSSYPNLVKNFNATNRVTDSFLLDEIAEV